MNWCLNEGKIMAILKVIDIQNYFKTFSEYIPYYFKIFL